MRFAWSASCVGKKGGFSVKEMIPGVGTWINFGANKAWGFCVFLGLRIEITRGMGVLCVFGLENRDFVAIVHQQLDG